MGLTSCTEPGLQSVQCTKAPLTDSISPRTSQSTHQIVLIADFEVSS